MNANELADDLEYACTVAEPRIEMMKRMKLCATMLRQQQAEIEALKQVIDANNLSQNIGQFVKPAKTLTDEEIDVIGIQALKDTASITWGQDAIYEFARAILRKAQEK